MTALPEQLDRDETYGEDVGALVAEGEAGAERRVRATVSRPRDLRRIFRYSATSLLALGVSEIFLVGLDAETSMGATLAALLANLAGTVPSYLLARYWIWSEADRRRAGRQIVLYWITSLVSMGISSVVTGAIADQDHAHHLLKLIVLGMVYLVVSLVLWVAKYVAYQTVIFRPATTAPAAAGRATAGATTTDMVSAELTS